MPEILVDDVSFSYGREPTLADVDLHVRDGEFMVVVGPSGSGKTTLLRIIAGLEKQSSGHIYIGERRVDDVPAARRGIALLFQEMALYPHMTVRRNIAFPLEVRKAEEVRAKVEAIARELRITRHLERTPGNLSAGEKHAVATGRTVVSRVPVVLMDEPFVHVDARTRERLRTELRQLKSLAGATVLLATNDQDVAMSMADRIAVLDGGRLQQVAEPRRLYREPDNVFVAGFIGTMNLLRGTVERGAEGLVVALGSRRLRLPGDQGLAGGTLQQRSGRPVLVGMRPEALRFGGGHGAEADEQRLGGIVSATEYLGNDVLVYVVTDADGPDGEPNVEIQTRVPADARIEPGQHLALAVAMDRLHYFDAGSGRRLA